MPSSHFGESKFTGSLSVTVSSDVVVSVEGSSVAGKSTGGSIAIISLFKLLIS